MERNPRPCFVRCCTGRCGCRGMPTRGRLQGSGAWHWTWGEGSAPALNSPTGVHFGVALKHAGIAVCRVYEATLYMRTGLQACCPDGQKLLLSRHF